MQALNTVTPKLNLLVAYPYLSKPFIKLIAENQQNIRFLLDSGAFTAQTLGKKISLDDYCRFIESLPFKPWRYFTLDVIGDPGQTLANYQKMLDRGFKPVPILTQGEDFSVMDDFWKTSDVVGIGGLVHVPLKAKQKFIYDVMQYAKGRRVHWLGFCNDQFVKYFRPYMCDSSAWRAAQRFGLMNIYLGLGRNTTLKKTELINKPSQEILNRIVSWGFDPYSLKILKNWHGNSALSNRINAASFVDKSCDYEKHLSVKLFLATAAECHGKVLIEAINRKVKLYDTHYF